MLKYFLQEEGSRLTPRMKANVKKKFIKKRQYRPFHLDCQYSKKKLCYCSCHPIANIHQQNKVQLWKNYEDVDNFFKGVQNQEVQQQNRTFQRCKEKIRALSPSQLAQFVRTFRNDKNLHMGENGEYDAV